MKVETTQMRLVATMEGNIEHSDTWIEIEDPYGDVKLRLTKEEMQKLAEETPDSWLLREE